MSSRACVVRFALFAIVLGVPAAADERAATPTSRGTSRRCNEDTTTPGRLRVLVVDALRNAVAGATVTVVDPHAGVLLGSGSNGPDGAAVFSVEKDAPAHIVAALSGFETTSVEAYVQQECETEVTAVLKVSVPDCSIEVIAAEPIVDADGSPLAPRMNGHDERGVVTPAQRFAHHDHEQVLVLSRRTTPGGGERHDYVVPIQEKGSFRRLRDLTLRTRGRKPAVCSSPVGWTAVVKEAARWEMGCRWSVEWQRDPGEPPAEPPVIGFALCFTAEAPASWCSVDQGWEHGVVQASGPDAVPVVTAP